MPDVKYKKILAGYTIEHEVRITKYRKAAMSCIVDDATDLRKKAQGIDCGFNGTDYLGSVSGAAFSEISCDVLQIAHRSLRIDNVHTP